jgi:hypothetical protein
MHIYSFKYLATAANRLIPKWAKNWEHLEQVAEFREALDETPPDEREKRLEACRRIGWRLKLAFETEDLYEREWLLSDARRINASYFPLFIVATNSNQPEDKVEMLPEGNPTDSLLRHVQTRLVKRMRVCHMPGCKRKYFFKDPGRKNNRREYCLQICFENAVRARKLLSYHTSPNSRKNRKKHSTN